MDAIETQPQALETSPARARSNANLIPFTAGPDSRRGNGRSSGASYIEWCNRLDVYTTEQLQEISKAPNGPRNPQSRAMAAETILRSRTEGFAKNGAPFAANDTDRIMDRTVGRPKQHVEVVKQEVKDPAALTLELMQLLADHPELRGALAGNVADNLVPALSDGEVVSGTGGAPMDDAARGE